MSLEKVCKGESLAQVVEILDQHQGEAKLIAGGTDLLIDMRNKNIAPKVLIDISKLEELRTIEDQGDLIEIGGAVSFTQIMESELFKDNLYGLSKASSLVGSPQIRNKATIGGNIANGSAAADSIPALICLDASLSIASLQASREVKLVDYFQEENKLKANEIITKISFKKPDNGQVLSFSKLGLRKALSISRLTIAMLLELEGERIESIKVASGALARYPMREIEIEDFLRGKVLNEENIRESIKVIQKSMDERLGARPTLPYKRVAVERMVREALEEGAQYSDKAVGAW